MPRLKLLCLLLMWSIPLFASEPMTVQQFEQFVGQLQGKSDKEVLRRLAGIKLTERLSTERLNRLQGSISDAKFSEPLLTIADASALLELPSSDLPPDPAPDVSAQKQMLSRAVDFVAATTAHMPDFLTQRRTLRFEDVKYGLGNNDPIVVTPGIYHLVDDETDGIRYGNGHEELQNSAKLHSQGETNKPKIGLTTWGVFGQMLQTVTRDALEGSIIWSHWEQSASGRVAVFRYTVPKERATFRMKWCCAWKGPGNFEEVSAVPGYHGELSVDPQSGAVTRMTLVANPDPSQPIASAALFVEYGPVDIAGKTYVVPARSATLLTAKYPVQHGTYGMGDMTMYYQTKENLVVTAISDSRFEQYHVFRSEVRIVPQ